MCSMSSWKISTECFNKFVQNLHKLVNVNTVHTEKSFLPQEGVHKINISTLNTSWNGMLPALTPIFKWQQVPALAVLSIFRKTGRVLEKLMGLFQTLSSPSLWNRYVYYHVHKNLPHAHILIQINPVNILPLYLCKIPCNITIPHSPKFSKWSPFFIFPHQNLTRIYFSPSMINIDK
jgi:hypothetical protein